MPKERYIRRKKRFILLVILASILLVLFVLYSWGKAYLYAILKKNPTAAVEEDALVAVADNISIEYVDDSGVVVEYYTKRTKTSSTSDVIEAVDPDLSYKFPNSTREPIRIIADTGTFDQKNKVAFFQGNVFLEQGALTVRANEAELDILNNKAVFPSGGVMESKGHTVKGSKFVWYLKTNSLEVEDSIVFIVK